MRGPRHQKIFAIFILILFGLIISSLLIGCRGHTTSNQVTENAPASATVVKTTVAPTISLPTETHTPQTPTLIPPTVTATTAPSQPQFATVVPFADWLVYENSFYGYQFRYPPAANIEAEGVLSYPTEEKPEGMSHDAYLNQLQETYPDNICVAITYQSGFITILAPWENGGSYTTPCGTSGIGAEYDLLEKTEMVMVNGELYPSEGIELWSLEQERAVRELYDIDLPDGTKIHYGRSIGISDDEGRKVREILLQIIETFHKN